jgi:hypothetical protein
MGYFDIFDNEFLNKYEKIFKMENKPYRYVTYRLMVIQILYNFIII